MKSLTVGKFFPCAGFLAEGSWGKGVAAALMQISLVLWPLAARWARAQRERGAIEKLLHELSETHAVPQMRYPYTGKKFRQAA